MTKEELKKHFDKYQIECDTKTHSGQGHVDDSFDLVYEAVMDLLNKIENH